MKKFRVLSDLHIDYNKKYPISIEKDKDVFTVICGDTSGYPDKTIVWIKENCPNGVGVSGNHLPYNDYDKPIQQLRNELAIAFPAESSFTYLDCETGTFCKDVDGILFIGTCMYTDMSIKHKIWNPDGDIELNKRCSAFHMNDYKWGIKDNSTDPYTMVSPTDYCNWFKNAYEKIENVLNENEKLDTPKAVVLITHHPIITDFLKNNGYLDQYVYSIRYFNDASYASDMKSWIKRHTSIKCYCCGHIHNVFKNFRNFDIIRDDGSRCLVVNNARGYVSYGHDTYFDINCYVNTETWTIEK